MNEWINYIHGVFDVILKLLSLPTLPNSMEYIPFREYNIPLASQ
jgi:hypothetical protein